MYPHKVLCHKISSILHMLRSFYGLHALLQNNFTYVEKFLEASCFGWTFGLTLILNKAFSDPCKIHGICGLNGVCSYDHVSGRKCSCLQGFKMKDHTDWSYGCEPEFSVACNNINESSFIQLAHVEYYSSDIRIIPYSSVKTNA